MVVCLVSAVVLLKLPADSGIHSQRSVHNETPKQTGTESGNDDENGVIVSPLPRCSVKKSCSCGR